MEILFDPAILAGLATLIVLEVVLGIDNLVFIAILADKLPPEQRDKARLLGLSLALLMRLALLASIAWIVGLTATVFSVGSMDFSWRDLILAGGGLFLLVKATKEIHERIEGGADHGPSGPAHAGFWIVITQIIALDAVFSLDSIITAVGMVDELWVMIAAVIIAMAIMIAASKPLTSFVGRHPTVIILCLSFLLLIGLSLLAEGFGFHMPKGYLYAAIGFSILIEGFNQIRSRNRQKALAQLPLRQRAADGIFRLLAPRGGPTDGDSDPTGAAASDAPSDEQAFQPSEREMIRGVIELADLPVRAIMTARTDIFWLDVDESMAINRERLIASGRTRVLICKAGLDHMLGVVETRTLLAAMLREDVPDLAELAERPLIVPDELTALRLTDVLRETGERFAIVVDSHGTIDGVVTATDIFAAIAGDLAEDEDEASLVQAEDGSFEVDANLPLATLADALDREWIGSAGRYRSVGGYLLFEFGRMPDPGERISRDGLSFEVKSILASRIDRVIVRDLAGVS